MRLSNSVTEINTIMNQCRAMLDATVDFTQRPSARDELDLVGQLFDIFATPEGKEIVKDPRTGECMPAYLRELRSDRFGGRVKMSSSMFRSGGAYFEKVVSRISEAANPSEEAARLVKIVSDNGDVAHNRQMATTVNALNEDLAQLQAVLGDGAKTPAEREAAIRKFAEHYATSEVSMLNGLEGAAMSVEMIRMEVKPPSTFASAITDILFANFQALGGMLTLPEGLKLWGDASTLASTELGVKGGDVVDAIIDDAKKMGGDTSYKIDIGV